MRRRWLQLIVVLALFGAFGCQCGGPSDYDRPFIERGRSGEKVELKPERYIDEGKSVDHVGERLVEQLDLLERELKDKPRTPEIDRALGDLYYRNGRYADAVASYQAFLEARPGVSDIRGRVATALLLQSRPREAIGQLEICLEMAPENTDCIFALATTLTRDGDGSPATRERASGLFRRLLALQPGHPHAEAIERALRQLAAAPPATSQPAPE